jgi:hypothetical protein
VSSLDLGPVAVVVGIGAAALAAATWLALREPAAATESRAHASSPLVPWLGSLAAVALAIRGALVAAGVVLLATLVHAGLARWRASRPGHPRPRR